MCLFASGRFVYRGIFIHVIALQPAGAGIVMLPCQLAILVVNGGGIADHRAVRKTSSLLQRLSRRVILIGHIAGQRVIGKIGVHPCQQAIIVIRINGIREEALLPAGILVLLFPASVRVKLIDLAVSVFIGNGLRIALRRRRSSTGRDYARAVGIPVADLRAQRRVAGLVCLQI